MSGPLRRVREGVGQRPQTAVLVAALTGLLAGPRAGVLLVVVAPLALLVARDPRTAGLLAVVAGAGALVADIRVTALDPSAPPGRLGHALKARATLLDSPRATRFGWRATAAVRGERLLLIGRGAAPALPAGRIVEARGLLRAPAEHEAWLRPKRLHVVLEARSVRDTGDARRGTAGVLDVVRTRTQRALQQRLPPPEGALLRGMVLGDDSALEADERERLRRAGLGHLVAASGANIALLSALGIAACAAVGAGLRVRLLLVLALIGLYVPLAGAGPSIQRAGVMGAAAIAATLAARPVSRVHVLLLAAAATLALDPGCIADPAWQLSFAAVVAIAALAPPLAGAMRRLRVPRLIADASALTLAATVGTAPVSAAVFGTVSPAGLLANVLAAPLVACATWIGMTAAVVAQVSQIGGALTASLAGPPLALLLAISRGCSQLPAAQVAAPALGVAAACAGTAALVLSARARSALPRLAPVAALLVVLAVVLTRDASFPPPAAGALRVAFLEVGQGDATLIQSGGRAVLVDAGPPDGGAVDRLRRLGVDHLDVLVATHAQADHIGEADAVLRELPVGTLLDGRDGVREPHGTSLVREATRRGVRIVPAAAGQRFQIGGAGVEVLWPPPRSSPRSGGEDPNERAVIMRVTASGASALLAADAESQVLSRLDLGAVDLLKVSHHGSADPGLPMLLRRLRPRLAVIEVGARNRYGHPAPATLSALRAARVPVRRTDADGTVVVDLTSGGMRVQTLS